jgi:hypothetical protein
MYSNIHRGSNITCPFCARGFTTATGVTHHLERGSCPQARTVNHETILSEIRSRDPHHTITKKLLTQSSKVTATKTTVTHASYNRAAMLFECYLCHKGFLFPKALGKHVNSGVHRQNVYRCPGGRCKKEFKALASLFSHLESGRCGAVRFEAVQRNAGSFFDGGRRIVGFA